MAKVKGHRRSQMDAEEMGSSRDGDAAAHPEGGTSPGVAQVGNDSSAGTGGSAGNGSASIHTTSDAVMEDLQRRLDEKTQEAQRYQEDYLRAIADMQNVRRRVQQDADDARSYANIDLVKQLLPIMDNFELAIRHSENDRSFEGLLQGVQQILKQMRETLQKVGVDPIDALGQPFDPEYHEAIGQVPSEKYAEGTVAEDIRTGYQMKGRLVRPSLVRVAG